MTKIIVTKRRQCLVLLASFLAQFIAEGVVMSFTIYYPTLLHHFRSSNAELSLIGSLAYGIWCGIGPVSGYLVDKFGSTPVVFLSALVGSAAIFLGSFSSHLWQVILTFGVYGLCSGMILIPAITVISGYFGRCRGLATTAATIGGATGAVCYPLLFQYILVEENWQYCFVMTAGLNLQLVVCSLLLKQNPVEKTAKDHTTAAPSSDIQDEKVIVKNEKSTKRLNCEATKLNLGLYAAHSFLWNITGFGFVTILPLFFDHNGRTVTDIALIISMCSFMVIIGRVAAAMFCTWKRGDRVLLYNVCTLLTATFTASFAVNASFEIYCSLVCLYGVSVGVQTALMPIVTLDVVEVEKKLNTSFGVVIFACGAAGLISPFFSGWLIDTLSERYDYVFAIVSLPCFLCCFLMLHMHWPLSRYVKRRQSEETSD